jgi:hypothetical protein
MTAVELVQQQLDAYNARDLDRFVAAYSDTVRVYRPPANEPVLAGREAFARFYATQRFHLPALRAEVLHRLVVGNCVIDHERVHGVREHPFEAAAVYVIADGLINAVWFFSGD